MPRDAVPCRAAGSGDCDGGARRLSIAASPRMRTADCGRSHARSRTAGWMCGPKCGSASLRDHPGCRTRGRESARHDLAQSQAQPWGARLGYDKLQGRDFQSVSYSAHQVRWPVAASSGRWDGGQAVGERGLMSAIILRSCAPTRFQPSCIACSDFLTSVPRPPPPGMSPSHPHAS